MARYRRYRRRGYRKSTNTIMMKFQSFMDVNTKKDEMQIISINAGGKEILQRLPAQFGAYKYYRIGNISAKFVPASTLPVDPTGLSYEVGENPTVDPRDQLTPGMMRITNGEDVLEDLTGLDANAQHQLYNAMMLDPRWYKWMLQSGVKRHATPRYWTIGQLHQDKWPGATINLPQDGTVSGTTGDTSIWALRAGPSSASGTGNVTGTFIKGESSMYGLFQTGHKGVLGWMPTDGLGRVGVEGDKSFLVSPPEIEVMKVILPPAYKTEYYYRIYISETVYFKEPKMMAIGVEDFPYRPLDVFARPGKPVMSLPTQSVTGGDISDNETGGNYGNY